MKRWVLHLSAMAMQHQEQRRIVTKSSYNPPQFLFDAHNHIHLSLQVRASSEKGQSEQIEQQDTAGGYSIPPLSFEGNNVNSDNFPTSLQEDIINHANAVMKSFCDDGRTDKEEGCNEVDGVNHEENLSMSRLELQVQGVAIMSTQPRDFPIVEQLVQNLEGQFQSPDKEGKKLQHAIPCFGVHPWFLKQANEEFDRLNQLTTIDDYNDESLSELKEAIQYETNNSEKTQILPWLPYLYDTIMSNANSHVGEIGLDNARWDNPDTKELVCPMEVQIAAFEIQLHMAAHLNKAVSIHSVRCWGILVESIRKVKKQRQQLKKKIKKERKSTSSFLVLPPRLYFHAFGGNSNTVDQINSICCKDTTSETFYGFAPVINFRSPKTADTIRKVGIESLVLESDLEDYNGVLNDLKANIAFVANALGLSFEEVLTKSNENARRLYNVGPSRDVIYS